MPNASYVLPGHIRVIERGWLSSNNIVLTGGSRHVVVDTGYVSHAQQTLQLVAQALDNDALGLIVNTHLHSDHAGGNASLKQQYGCPLWIPKGESELVSSWDEDKLSYRKTGQSCAPFMHDEVVDVGDELELGRERWQVLSAPGHDHAMVMLWCARLGVLISADALWQKGFGVLFPALAGASAFAEQRQTLLQIQALEPAIVIPGHGAPFSQHDQQVRASLTYAQDRLNWFEQEPKRHIDHALKVLLAFKLLELRAMRMTAIDTLLQSCLNGNAALLDGHGGDTLALARALAQDLVKSGVATWEGTPGECLIARQPAT